MGKYYVALNLIPRADDDEILLWQINHSEQSTLTTQIETMASEKTRHSAFNAICCWLIFRSILVSDNLINSDNSVAWLVLFTAMVYGDCWRVGNVEVARHFVVDPLEDSHK